MTSLGTEYPQEQERCRNLLLEYFKLRDTPGVNVNFAIGTLTDLLRRADVAAMTGDVVEMIRIYRELKETQ